MSDNKLLSLFNALDGIEKRECSNYLNSPYFNQRDDVRQLWAVLLKNKGQMPDPEVLFREVYPEAVFDTARWHHLQSFLVARIEGFLAQRAAEQFPLWQDLQLAPVYRKKKLDKPLQYLLQRAGNQLGNIPQNRDFFYWQYLLEWEKYAAVESNVRSRDNNLAQINRALDTYLISSKLRLACLIESHKAVFNTQYEAGFLPALVAFLENDALREAPIIALYYHCYRALTAGAESDFRAFRRQLEQQSDQLPVDERRTFLLLAVNYCIRRLNTGEMRYVREAFDLYRVALDTGALIENGLLSRFAFKNIVALGLRLEEFGWVENFIAKYEPQLEEKYRAANRDYNLARLYFSQKNYQSAMPLLAQVDESDLLLNLDSRVMLLKMYFETGEWDALDALISSFKILLLRKKKVIGYHQSHYLNTLRYMQKLVRLNRNDKEAVANFQQELENNKAVIEKDWLLARTL